MSKELLTEILEAIQDFQQFLTSDLQHEPLGLEAQNRRQLLQQKSNDIITKIRGTHVSIRPRLVTPSSGSPGVGGTTPPLERKAAAKPPAPPPPAEIEEEEDIQRDTYVDCEHSSDVQVEDYLTFTSQNSDSGGMDTYVAINNEDEVQDLYEEAVQGTTSPLPLTSSVPSQPYQEDIPEETYEEPTLSPPPAPSVGLTPPTSSAENSGSGAVYMKTGAAVTTPETTPSEVATTWIYDLSGPKSEKRKVSQLENVTCKGNLEKLGGKNKKSWQVRYCVLSGVFMYFYEKESSKTYRNRIVLAGYNPEEAPQYTNTKKRQFAFKLTHTDEFGKQKDYFFRSTKRESCETWLKSLHEARKVLTSSTPVKGLAVTMPRPLSHNLPPVETRPKSNSLDDIPQDTYEAIGLEEIVETGSVGSGASGSYEDVNPNDVELDQDSYEDVNPLVAREEMEEYVPVVSHEEEFDESLEDYEAPSDLQPHSQPLLPPRNDPPSLPPPSSLAPPTTMPPPPSQRPDPVINLDKVYESDPNRINLKQVYVTLWDFFSSEEDELSMHRGDLVYVLDADRNAEWWAGEGLNSEASERTGKRGFFPSSYVMEAFEEVSI